MTSTVVWQIIIFVCTHDVESRAKAIAPLFRLRLLSCGPGFKTQAHHRRSISKEKEAGIDPYLQSQINICYNKVL